MDSTSIHYNSTAQQNNLLFCLHGNSTNAECFNFLKDVSPNWQVVAPDYIGNGRSPKLQPDDYHYDNFIHSLIDLLATFTYQKLVVVGHSLGGNFALELLNTIKMDGLVLIGAPPISYTRTEPPYLQLHEMELTDNQTENISKLRAYFQQMSNNPDSAEYLTTTFLQTDPIFREKLLEEFAKGKFSDQLKNLQNSSVKTACIMGQNDTIANNDYLNKLHNEGLFASVVNFDDTGHYALLDKPKACKQFIHDFLNML